MKFKKGYALALAILLTIILIVSSIGLYLSIEHLVKEIRGGEIESIIGYYVAIAALRYAHILLEDPSELTFVKKGTGEDAYYQYVEMFNVDGWNSLYADIGISRDDIDVRITKPFDGNPYVGPYNARVTYKGSWYLRDLGVRL